MLILIILMVPYSVKVLSNTEAEVMHELPMFQQVGLSKMARGVENAGI